MVLATFRVTSQLRAGTFFYLLGFVALTKIAALAERAKVGRLGFAALGNGNNVIDVELHAILCRHTAKLAAESVTAHDVIAQRISHQTALLDDK